MMEDNAPNIWIASSEGDIDRVKLLLSQGLSVDEQDNFGYTPLQAAVSYSHIELVKFLVENGSNVNLCDNERNSPLHYCDTPECAQYLLEHGADPSVRNLENMTPLESAMDDESEEMVQFFYDLCQPIVSKE